MEIIKIYAYPRLIFSDRHKSSAVEVVAVSGAAQRKKQNAGARDSDMCARTVRHVPIVADRDRHVLRGR